MISSHFRTQSYLFAEESIIQSKIKLSIAENNKTIKSPRNLLGGERVADDEYSALYRRYRIESSKKIRDYLFRRLNKTSMTTYSYHNDKYLNEFILYGTPPNKVAKAACGNK